MDVKKFLIAAALAAALIAGASASQAEAKVFHPVIGGVPHVAETGLDGSVDRVRWKEDGRTIQLRWKKDSAKSAVDETVDGKVISKQAKKVRKSAGNKAATSKTSRKIVAAAAVAPVVGAAFKPVKPLGFLDRITPGIWWIVTGQDLCKPQIPKVVTPVAPATAPSVKSASPASVGVPPTKEAVAKKAKKRVIKKRAPPKAKPCENVPDIMSIPTQKPVQYATPPKIPPALTRPQPAQDMAKIQEVQPPPAIAALKNLDDLTGRHAISRPVPPTRVVHQVYVQWPQKLPDGGIWVEFGRKLTRPNPHDGSPEETVEIPIQGKLFYAESQDGMVHIQPVFGPHSEPPAGFQELNPIRKEEKRS